MKKLRKDMTEKIPTVFDAFLRLHIADVNDSMWNSINGVSDFSPTFSGSAQITDAGGASSTQGFYRIYVLP